MAATVSIAKLTRSGLDYLINNGVYIPTDSQFKTIADLSVNTYSVPFISLSKGEL
jgi:hypothetical protein